MDQARELQRLLARIERDGISRRNLMRRGAAMGLGTAALAAALGNVGGPQRGVALAARGKLQADPGAGVRGGTLRVATIGEPATMDEHQTTAGITAELGYCMYECLFTYDASFQPMLELAESHTISEDGLTHTLVLRQGVPFHNGETMTADDVIASLTRWGEISGVGQRLMEATTELAKADDHTIEFRLSRPYGTLAIALAHNTQAAVIYPKSVIDAGNLEPLTEFVGTGPYRLLEWRPDAFMRFERFEEYAALEAEPNGYGGRKYAYADQIEFIPVPDEAARVAGLQAGDYELALEIGNDQYEVLNGAPGIVTEILEPTNWDVFFLNWDSPLMSNLAMRQAVQAALDAEPMLLSGRGSQEFIRLDPGLMMLGSPWHTDAGAEFYNMNDPELARTKLEEAGYDGTPIRFMTTQEYSYMYGESIVAAQQLEAAGFTVDLQVIDWATLLERRAQREEWDMFSTGHGFVPDPSQVSYVGQMNVYPGWWSDEEALAASAELLAEAEFDVRYPIWEQVQEMHYTQIPAIKIGDSSTTSFRSERIGGWSPVFQRGLMFWNFWLEG
ncbi:MAG: ABC transporter substrate-binding protein [Chloroflexota bacterium]|nr:ABC transporter substrate-binding protein [Chloroflexota bacterium]